MLLKCDIGKDSWGSLGLQGDPASPSYGRSVLGVHWKDWCWRWNYNTWSTWCKDLTHLKRPWCWERLRAEWEGVTAHEMVGWHHQFSGHAFGQTLGLGDGQGGLACYSPWGCKESDATERLNWTDLDLTSKFEEIALWQYTELLETFGFRYLFGFPHNVDSGVYSAKRKVLISRYRSQW